MFARNQTTASISSIRDDIWSIKQTNKQKTNKHLCFICKDKFTAGWGATPWSVGLQRDGWACDKESLSKDGRKLQSRVQRLKAHIFHSPLLSLDHNFVHLWLVWDFPATAVGCSRPAICDRLLSIKRTPRCLGIVLCLISIWQSGWVNRLWISLNPLYSWASSVWAVTVKTSFCSVKKNKKFRPYINPICISEKTRYHVQHATH